MSSAKRVFSLFWLQKCDQNVPKKFASLENFGIWSALDAYSDVECGMLGILGM